MINKVCFNLTPEAHFLTEEDFMNGVDREKIKTKLSHLVNGTKHLIQKLKHEWKLTKWLYKYIVVMLFFERVRIGWECRFLITVALNGWYYFHNQRYLAYKSETILPGTTIIKCLNDWKFVLVFSFHSDGMSEDNHEIQTSTLSIFFILKEELHLNPRNMRKPQNRLQHQKWLLILKNSDPRKYVKWSFLEHFLWSCMLDNV